MAPSWRQRSGRSWRGDPSMTTLVDMRRHVEDLVASLSRADDQIEVHWIGRPRRARAAPEIGVIWIPRVHTEISYATALHEVGHFYGRHQRSRRALMRERAAWDWARRNAKKWTPRMERHAQKALAWYAAKYGEAAKLPAISRIPTQ